MSANRKRFLHNLPTLRTFLRGEARLDSYDLMTGSCSLILKDIEKGTPPRVHDGLGKEMIFHHIRDVQVLNTNMLIGLGVGFGGLKGKVTPLAGNFEMGFCNETRSFLPAVTAPLAARKRALLAPECLLKRTIEARVGNSLALTISQEGFKTDINADGRMLTLRRQVSCLWLNLANNQDIPMPIGSKDKVRRFRLALKGSVQLDFDGLANLCRNNEMLLILVEIAVLAVLSQLDGVPSIWSLETWKTNPSNAVFPGCEEAFEGLRKPIGKHLDGCRRDMFTLSLKCHPKVILGRERLHRFVLRLDSLKHRIIDLAAFHQARHQFAILLSIGHQAIFKRSHTCILPKIMSIVKNSHSPAGLKPVAF